MRLHKKQIDLLSHLIFQRLKESDLVRFKQPEKKIEERIAEVIAADLKVEDDLDREVKQMLEKFKPQIASGEIDPHKMFLMIKKQLIKDRNLVI